MIIFLEMDPEKIISIKETIKCPFIIKFKEEEGDTNDNHNRNKFSNIF